MRGLRGSLSRIRRMVQENTGTLMETDMKGNGGTIVNMATVRLQ